MREIKFRAWDKKSKKIREVNFIAFHNKRDAFSFNPSNTPKVIHLWGRNMIEDKDIILHREENDVVLMQFTGLKDKNGVDIYEGDITNYGEVVFENGCFGIITINSYFLSSNDANLHFYEIIGNIHEHPNLLK